jgi:hypothetical protein
MKQSAMLAFRMIKTWVCLLLAFSTISGCVLPGGDRPVGAITIKGRVGDVSGSPKRGEVSVVRREFSQQQQFDALFQKGNQTCNPARRYSVRTDLDGRFTVELPSFLSGDPIWIIPPFGTLLPLGGRADDRGLVVLLKTPDPGSQVYEINIRGDKPSIRILNTATGWTFQKLSAARKPNVQVTARLMTTNLTEAFSIKIRDVAIDISE